MQTDLKTLRNKIEKNVNYDTDPDKVRIINRLAVVIAFGRMHTALLPLLEGEGFNKEVVQHSLGIMIKEIISETELYDIKAEDLVKGYDGIDSEKEAVPFSKSTDIFDNDLYVLQQYLSGKMDNMQVLYYLKGVSLYLQIDFNECLEMALK